MKSRQIRTDLVSLACLVSAENVDPALTSVEIQLRIDEITAALRGPLSNAERGWLVVDRRELRERLAELAE